MLYLSSCATTVTVCVPMTSFLDDQTLIKPEAGFIVNSAMFRQVDAEVETLLIEYESAPQTFGMVPRGAALLTESVKGSIVCWTYKALPKVSSTLTDVVMSVGS